MLTSSLHRTYSGAFICLWWFDLKILVHMTSSIWWTLFASMFSSQILHSLRYFHVYVDLLIALRNFKFCFIQNLKKDFIFNEKKIKTKYSLKKQIWQFRFILWSIHVLQQQKFGPQPVDWHPLTPYLCMAMSAFPFSSGVKVACL